MSGIAGHICARGQLLDAVTSTDLCTGLRARGPGRLTEWSHPRAALYHLHLGPGDVGHSFDAAGDAVVLGDIRIDNRATLLRDLEIPDAQTLTDARLIAAAWKVWGPDLCARLVGDFAIAIFEPARNRMFLARDALGVRPLFWRQVDQGIAFASDARILCRDAPPAMSDDELITYLSGAPRNPETTQYPGVRRVQPGHWLEWQAGAVETSRYWDFSLQERTPPDPKAAFRDQFRTAVADRLSGPGTVAAMLSGGLDSSSICVVANRETDTPLRTYSLTYPGQSDADETPYIDAVLATGEYDPVRIPMTEHPPFDAFDALLKRHGGPFEAPGLTKSAVLFRQVARDGYTVLLSGHGGDEVVWTGVTRVLELARQKRFLRALPLVPVYARASGRSSAAVMVALLRTHGPQNRALQRVCRSLAQRLRPRDQETGALLRDRCLNTDTTRQTQTPQRSEPDRSDPNAAHHLDRAHHVETLSSPLVQRAFEILDAEAAAAGIELRFPFYDRRLVEFCVALPASEKFAHGQTRSILRRGLKGILPAKIARRRDKTDFSAEIGRRLVRHHDEILRDVADDATGRLHGILDMPALRDAIDTLRRDPDRLGGRDIGFLWRVASLHLWMRMMKTPKTGDRP
ncbi:asparagine synthetase B [Marivita sp.]|uniref:asparagine synthetase B family protein n=1 Tax=Marivita sp. TaxID=2003365 RepID=UPI0025B9EA43|nr:asparagine synthetase B [Marivita sp.]